MRRSLLEKAGRGFSGEGPTMVGGGTELGASGDTRRDWLGSTSRTTQWSWVGHIAPAAYGSLYS